MAGFFGFFDYTKPGPGVPKDAPPKSPFIVFFEILQRKFWNFIKVNLMFLFFNLPALILGMFVLVFLFPNIFPNAFDSPEMLINDIVMKFILLTPMMCIPMITVGPAQAGFTYIMRNYSREEHAFLWGDFKDTALKNMKQSLIVGTINFFVTFLMLFSIRAYLLISNGNFVIAAGSAIMILAFVIFAMMNMYIYPMMITFELSIKQLYKNALIFAVIKFLPNLGILILSVFIILFSFGLIIPFSQVIGILLYLFLTVSFIGFLTNFYVYPKLKKYMISRVESENDDMDEEDSEDDEDENEEENVDKYIEKSVEDGSVNDESRQENEDPGEFSEQPDNNANTSGDEYGEGHVGEDGIKRYF